MQCNIGVDDECNSHMKKVSRLTKSSGCIWQNIMASASLTVYLWGEQYIQVVSRQVRKADFHFALQCLDVLHGQNLLSAHYSNFKLKL